MKRVLFSTLFFCGVTLINTAYSIDRDIDIMKATKKTDLRVMACIARDETDQIKKVNASLQEENKKLEATIEPRSWAKGWNQGCAQGGNQGWAQARLSWGGGAGIMGLTTGALIIWVLNKYSRSGRNSYR